MSKTKVPTENVSTENAATAAAMAKEKKGDLMYLGPTISGAVRHSTVFKNGVLPKAAQECVAEFPMMERLFVEVDKMPDAIKELNKKQSALSAVYAQVAAHFNAQKFKRRV